MIRHQSDRFLAIFRFENQDSADLFPAFSVGAVRNHGLAAAESECRSIPVAVERLATYEMTVFLKELIVCKAFDCGKSTIWRTDEI